MDRRKANRDINSGLIAAGIAMLIFALAFYAAVFFIG